MIETKLYGYIAPAVRVKGISQWPGGRRHCGQQGRQEGKYQRKHRFLKYALDHAQHRCFGSRLLLDLRRTLLLQRRKDMFQQVAC